MTQDTTTTSGAADLPEALLFTKKPVTIAAIQWTGKNLREVIAFTDGPPDTRTTHAGMAWEAYTDLVARDGLKIYTLEGKMLANPGDWIIRGVKGEFYPCKNDIFEATYSPAALPAGQATAAQAGVPANMRLCYSCGHPADAHPWVNDPRGGKRRGDCPAAPAQPAAPQGVAYAALPDECEMLKHALWVASSFTVHRYLMSNAEGRWSGAEKATCHDELCCLYVAVFRGVEVDQVRVGLEADWMAVHDATQELTDHMDAVIGFPLKGVPDYDALAPKFFDHFHRLATHTLRASHGQAPAWATKPTEQQILEAAFAPDQPAAEPSRFGSPELQAMIIARCVEKDQADSVPAVSDLPPLPAPDLRDVGTKPQEIKEFLKGYATEYARTAIAARTPEDSVQEDAARLDYLHSTGSTIEMLPGEVDFYPMRFRVGGLHSAVSPNLREAIDAARKQGEKQ